MATVAGGLQVVVEVPLDGAAAEPAAVLGVARALEAAGFDGLGFTDHPAPSRKWLAAGGHPTYDPFAALAFCAAATERIRLLTYLAVLPYRNPMLMAKSIATVDRLSGGRLTVAVGAGYLRSEFLALGQPFDERNDLVDEALAVLDGVFDENGFTFQGRHFSAQDQVVDPGPVQRPRPPIWIGGSSRRSRQRAARCAEGWAPFLTDEVSARTTRTALMPTVEAFAAAVADLHELVEAEGRDPKALAVQVDSTANAAEALARPDEHHELLERLARCGATGVILRLPGGGAVGGTAELVARYGQEFLRL